MLRPLTAAVALVACAGVLALAAPAAAAPPTPTEKRLIERINEVRAKKGLRKLKLGAGVQRGARTWSRHLMRAGSFHHSTGLSPGTGEILAWGTCNWFSPRAAVRAWLRSPSHRVLLLRPGFRYVGVGWTRGKWRGFDCVKMAVARFR